MHGVTRVRHESDGCVRADGCRHRLGFSAELRVVLAGHQQNRDVHGREPRLQRFLRTGSRETHAARQSGHGVAGPLAAELHRLGQPREQGLLEPRVEEAFEALLFQPRRCLLVGSFAFRSRRGIFDASGPADDHEGTHDVGMGERDVEGEARPHRVAEIRRRSTGFSEEVGAAPQVRVDRRRLAVAGRVDADDFVIGGERRRELTPTVAVLREAVDEDDARGPSRRSRGATRPPHLHEDGLMADAPVTTQATFAATLVDEWIRAGVQHAFVAPGSRSTPMALALADRSELAVHVFHDERAAGFAALGAGAASGVPAVVLTTSGTAATHLHAAVVEADLGEVPLLVCTADRPPELRDVGAPQAIDQTHLYGRAVRWFIDAGVADEATSHTWRSIAARAVALTGGARPGPVHMNLPFRDPLVGRPGPLPSGRSDGRPWIRVPAPADAPVVVPDGRLLVVAGAGAHPSLGNCGWPVLADARSALEGPSVVTHADVFLRHPVTAGALRPDLIVRVGPPPASRIVNEWLDASGAEQLTLSASWRDPGHRASTLTSGAVSLPDGKPDWLEQWRAVDQVAETTIASVLASLIDHNEPGVARSVMSSLPPGARLVVASSMPVRDLEWYARPRHDVHVHANRGANGIDGTLSTAIGVTLASRAPTAVLLGDIAFLHDSTALIGVRSRGIDLTVVVVDNDGGGVFSFLPQATALDTERFEQLFGTPHGVKVEELAAAHGIASLTIEDPEAIGPSIRSTLDTGGVWLVVVRTDRAANVSVHAELNAAVAAALDDSFRTPG